MTRWGDHSTTTASGDLGVVSAPSFERRATNRNRAVSKVRKLTYTSIPRRPSDADTDLTDVALTRDAINKREPDGDLVLYRLTPAHRLPAGRDDVLDVASWTTSRSTGADPSKLTFLGGSAGGNLAVEAALATGQPAVSWSGPIDLAGFVVVAATGGWGAGDRAGRVPVTRLSTTSLNATAGSEEPWWSSSALHTSAPAGEGVEGRVELG